MGDVFKEQLVKKVPSRKDALIKAALIGAGFFIALIVYIVYAPLLPVALTAVGYGLYRFIGGLNKEYEYILTNGSLDIDCIINKARRKRVFSGDVKDFLRFVYPGEAEDGEAFDSAETTIPCGSGAANASTCVFLANYGGKRVKIIIEPNETMLKAMKPYLSFRMKTMFSPLISNEKL